MAKVSKWGFPGGSVVNNPPANTADMGLVLESESSMEKEMASHSWVFLLGKSHRQRNLAGYNPWGCKEWDMT